jgi:chromate transporter
VRSTRRARASSIRRARRSHWSNSRGTFNHIALASFVGGLSAWSREVLVVEKQWMGEAEFLSAMTMCRILPGANQVNMAVFAGSKMRGLLGAAAALLGLCLMPVVLIMVAGGPSILIVTLVGYGAGVTVGGVPGAIVGGLIATAAMLLPAASLMYVVTLFWQKAQKSKWRIAVEKGFAPLTVGLIMATSLVMSRAADHDWRAYTLTAICTAIFIFSKTNPLIVVFAAGVLGYFDIV